MDSLNTTADSLYQQKPMIRTLPDTPQIRHKISHFAAEISVEVNAHSRQECVFNFVRILFSLTEDEWTSAEENIKNKIARERLQEKQRLPDNSKKERDFDDLGKLAVHILDHLHNALDIYQKRVNKEVTQAIYQATGALNRIIEELSKMCKSNIEVASIHSEICRTTKRQEEKPCKPQIKFKKTQCANQQPSRIKEIRERMARMARQEHLRKEEDKYDQTSLKPLQFDLRAAVFRMQDHD